MTTDDDTEELWFWYNPSLDSLVRNQGPSQHVHGLFDSETEARQHLEHAADSDEYPNATHLELYKATVTLEDIEQMRQDQQSSDHVRTVDQMNVLDQRTLQQFVEGEDR